VKSIREFANQPLKWAKPSVLTAAYELRAGEDILATLRWEKTFGSLAVAESADGTWTFKRSGFLSPKVTVRVPGSESEVAVFKPSWKGEGTLQGPNGRSYQWLKTGFWRVEWAFANEAAEPLVHVKPEFAFFKLAAEVKVEPGAVSLPDLALLTLLGWYLVVLMLSEDGGGAAAAIIATG
jgi:hypothetical protein